MEPSLKPPPQTASLKLVSVIFYFIFGALYPTLTNVLYNLSFPYKGDLMLQFSKPWMITWGTELGLSLFLIPIAIAQKVKKQESSFSWSLFRATAIPGLCSLLAMVLSNYALLYLPPAVWKLIQFFGLLFTTLISSSSKENGSILLDWTGLLVIFMGLIISGTSILFQENFFTNRNPTLVLFSVIILIIVELVKAGQSRIEEIMLHEIHATSSLVATMEGIWGLFFTSFVFMPLCSISSPTSGAIIYENTLESFAMMGKGYLLPLLFAFLVVVVTIYGYLGTLVIEESDARRKNTFDSIMPVVVWLMSVITHYISGDTLVGESVEKNTSGEVIGFILSIVGTLIYEGIIKLPWITYDNLTDNNMKDADKSLAVDHNLNEDNDGIDDDAAALSPIP